MPKGKLLDNYKQGKVYKLLGAGITDVYVGSTCGSLDRRLWHHNYTHENPGQRQMTAAQLYQRSSCVTIELLETYPCEFKEQLAQRERYWIEKLKAEGVPVVNQNIPRAGLTAEQLCERRRLKANENLYHCPCGKTIQMARKESHLGSRLHANRLASISSQPPAINVSSSELSFQTLASSSTNPDTQPGQTLLLQSLLVPISL